MQAFSGSVITDRPEVADSVLLFVELRLSLSFWSLTSSCLFSQVIRRFQAPSSIVAFFVISTRDPSACSSRTGNAVEE